MIDAYKQTRYVKGARGPDEFDCYGLVRDARHRMFGRPMLPACDGVDPLDKRTLTACCGQVIDLCHLAPVRAREGAIATGWRGRLCVHVGIVVNVDGMLMILETDEPTGPTVTRVRRFESRYTQAIYYDN